MAVNRKQQRSISQIAEDKWGANSPITKAFKEACEGDGVNINTQRNAVILVKDHWDELGQAIGDTFGYYGR